jgi:predicted NUDIX family phosphoesterase
MSTTPKVKLALCVPLAALPANYRAIYNADGTPNGSPPQSLTIHSTFWHLASETHLVDRADCESNLNLRQLIPYGACVDDDGRIFTYSRGGEGGEGKLIGKLSIGLGGHVDLAPVIGQALIKLLQDEGNRELGEEGGLPPATLDFVRLLAATTPVDCVHCGVLFIRRVTAAEKAALTPEAGCIEKGEWLLPQELAAVQDRLEEWSKLALDYLNTEYLPLTARTADTTQGAADGHTQVQPETPPNDDVPRNPVQAVSVDAVEAAADTQDTGDTADTQEPPVSSTLISVNNFKDFLVYALKAVPPGLDVRDDDDGTGGLGTGVPASGTHVDLHGAALILHMALGDIQFQLYRSMFMGDKLDNVQMQDLFGIAWTAAAQMTDAASDVLTMQTTLVDPGMCIVSALENAQGFHTALQSGRRVHRIFKLRALSTAVNSVTQHLSSWMQNSGSDFERQFGTLTDVQEERLCARVTTLLHLLANATFTLMLVEGTAFTGLLSSLNSLWTFAALGIELELDSEDDVVDADDDGAEGDWGDESDPTAHLQSGANGDRLAESISQLPAGVGSHNTGGPVLDTKLVGTKLVESVNGMSAADLLRAQAERA